MQYLRRKIISALIYPATIIAVTIVVSLILLIFVIPQFQVMFDKVHIPLPFFTRMIISFSKFLRTFWWLLLIIIAGMIWGFRVLRKTNERVAKTIDALILRIYIIGPIIKKGIIARFTSTLAITLEA